MKVYIAGIDGYLGWTLTQYLATRGYEVGGCDTEFRRKWVTEMGSQSITPIAGIRERVALFKQKFGKWLFCTDTDMAYYNALRYDLRSFSPDTIVHLAEMPSAPWSMIDARHACITHANNVIGTLNLIWLMHEVCPEAHLVKLGSMGEWGTPDLDIPEGDFTVIHRGRTATLPFPKQPGSFYHATKSHDTTNIQLACRIWNLKATDIMQGVVYGVTFDGAVDDERMHTRFDIDQCFGTAINRFTAQAVIGYPLTVYGEGKHKRGFLPLQDSMQCLALAIEHPPQTGEYRVFNQFDEVYSLAELAQTVKEEGDALGMNVSIQNIENPRIEAEEHYYNPDRYKLPALGYKPTTTLREEIRRSLRTLTKYKDRVEEVKGVLMPDICWDGTRKKLGTINRTEAITKC